jgi:hypothetical protein
MFQVILINEGILFHLKGTVWTSATERRSTFETVEAAEAAKAKAAQFLPKRVAKRMEVRPV